MKEIEIKAHVKDRKATIENIIKFARYTQSVTRNDIYYHLDLMNRTVNGKPYISCRIRNEEKKIDEKTENTVFLTYKKKKLINLEDGSSMEVNDEKECVVSDSTVLDALFTDCGFKESMRKQKIVEDYTVETKYGPATLELCTIPELGDFLEIEILYDGDDSRIIDSIRKELCALLKQSGISENEIESKFYSQLLEEAKSCKLDTTMLRG